MRKEIKEFLPISKFFRKRTKAREQNSKFITTKIKKAKKKSIIYVKMSSETEGNNNVSSGDPAIFCLVCNSSLKEQLEHPKDEALVLVGGTNQQGTTRVKTAASDNENESTSAEPEAITRSQLSDAEWIRKYQTFLSKTLQLNFHEFGVEDELEPSSNTGGGSNDPKEEEVAMFCHKCKNEVERLYSVSEEVRVGTKTFDEIRDNIASSLVRTFVDRKQQGQGEGPEEAVDMDVVESNTTNELLERWKHIYTGEADKELRERNLISEIRDEAIVRDDNRGRTEFPEGTGFSAMELAKMQRMMTACYFTPKMSIVRKKGKLFFRVGIPKTDTEMAYNCLVCPETFTHQRSLNIHMRRHKTRRPTHTLVHTCQICAELFTDRKDLILHKQSQHVGAIGGGGPRIKYKRVQEFYTCGI